MPVKSFFFTALLLLSISSAFSQDHDPELIKFASTKLPASLGDFRILDTYARFKESGIKHELTDVVEDGFHAVFTKTKAKGVEKVELFFASYGALRTEADKDSCTIIGMAISFKSKNDCDKYLDAVGKPMEEDPMQWKFLVKADDPCTTVIILRDNDTTIRFFVTEGCGQG